MWQTPCASLGGKSIAGLTAKYIRLRHSYGGQANSEMLYQSNCINKL